MIGFMMLMYAGIKLSHLLSRHNPNISSFIERNILENTDVINFRDSQNKFAFAIEGYLDYEWKNDPRYVKLIARNKGRKNGVWYEEVFEHHRCTNEELEQFAPPTKEALQLMAKYRL